MKVPSYAIILPDGSNLAGNASRVAEAFQKHYVLNPNAVAVHSAAPTCGAVRDQVTALSDHPGTPTCMVVKISEYDGLAPRELWDLLNVWESA